MPDYSLIYKKELIDDRRERARISLSDLKVLPGEAYLNPLPLIHLSAAARPFPLRLRRTLPPPLIMPGQPAAAAPLAMIKLGDLMEPAALLAEALAESCNDNDRGLGVGLADFVSAVVALRLGEVGPAVLHLADGRGWPAAAAAAGRWPPGGDGGGRGRAESGGGSPFVSLPAGVAAVGSIHPFRCPPVHGVGWGGGWELGD